MPPIKEYQKARASQSEYVSPGRTSRGPQTDSNILIGSDDFATSNEGIAVGSEKYVCPTWSYHCRPSNPAPIDAGAPEDPSDKPFGTPTKDEVLVPREDSPTLPDDAVLESENYTCPPWSYHCRPNNPALIGTKASAQSSPSDTIIERQEEVSVVVPREKTSVPSESTVSAAEEYICPPWSYHCRPLNPASANTEAPSTNSAEKRSIEDAIIDKRSDAKAPHIIVPSPASVGPICTLSKDPSGVGFVEKCIPLSLDDGDDDTYNSALIKRGGDDDLVADVLLQHDLKSIPDSKCLISVDPSTDKMWVTMNATTPGNTCQMSRFEGFNLEERLGLMLGLVLLMTALIGLLVVYMKWTFKRIMKVRSKRSKKAKIPRAAKPTYPVHYERSAEDLSDCYTEKTNLSKPERCAVWKIC